LDHPLEERNTIEMQAVTALAHLRAAVLYIMDVSEQCGHTLEEQISLFENIKPLFTNKPLFVVVNKIDVKRIAELDEEQKNIFEQLKKDEIPVIEMSTVTEEGIMDIKSLACDKLLAQRVEAKMKGKKVNDVLNRLHLAIPAARDNKDRPAFIPDSVIKKKEGISNTAVQKKLERQIELEMDDEYILDLQKNWDLKNIEDKSDNIPEIWEGHNVADYIDPDILAKLDALEKEEEMREKAGFYDSDMSEEDEDMQELRKTASKIREVKTIRILESRENKRNEKPRMPRTGKKVDFTHMKKNLGKLGLEIEEDSHVANQRSRSKSRVNELKRKREVSITSRSASRARSTSKPPRDKSGVRDDVMAAKVRKMSKVAQRKPNQDARKGEADRHIFDLKPKHLFSGKRKAGKTTRR